MRVLSWLRTKGAARVSQAHAGKGKGDGKGKGKGDGKGVRDNAPWDAVVSWKPDMQEVGATEYAFEIDDMSLNRKNNFFRDIKEPANSIYAILKFGIADI